jgi:enamine deaminase RidA (YjgF/YER057c/UK114 family)
MVARQRPRAGDSGEEPNRGQCQDPGGGVDLRQGDRLVGPVGLLRQAARAEDQGGNVYLRDQVAVEARPSAMPAQARLALPNMEQVLAQVGATMGEVVAMI